MEDRRPCQGFEHMAYRREAGDTEARDGFLSGRKILVDSPAPAETVGLSGLLQPGGGNAGGPSARSF